MYTFPVGISVGVTWDLHIVCICMLSRFSCVRLSATLWTMACQAPLSWDSPGKDTGEGYYALLILQLQFSSVSVQSLSRV